jgi:hypothetical protein
MTAYNGYSVIPILCCPSSFESSSWELGIEAKSPLGALTSTKYVPPQRSKGDFDLIAFTNVSRLKVLFRRKKNVYRSARV